MTSRQKKHFDLNQIQDIIDSYQSGCSIKSIGSRYYCSERPIQRILMDHNISIRTNGEHNRSIILDGKKECSICKEWVLLIDFYCKGDHYGTGYIVYYHACKKCMRKKWSDDWEQHISEKFGITVEQYKLMLESQNNLCAICDQPERRMKEDQPQRLSIDHCHITGKVRGLLCNNCNILLGFAKDNKAQLKRAIEYLTSNY